MHNIFAQKMHALGESTEPTNDVSAHSTTLGHDPPLPEYLNKFRTKGSIPVAFREAAALPGRLAISDDRTPALKVVNQSYERQKKIE